MIGHTSSSTVSISLNLNRVNSVWVQKRLNICESKNEYEDVEWISWRLSLTFRLRVDDARQDVPDSGSIGA